MQGPPVSMLPSMSLLLATLTLAGASSIPTMPGAPWARRQRLGADSADVCQGRQTTCADDETLRVCADLGTGFVPVSTMQCPKSGTPFCLEGRCVAELPNTTVKPARPTPAPAPPSTDDSVCHGEQTVCADCYTRTLCGRVGSHLIPVSNQTCDADTPYCVDGQCKPDLPVNTTCKPVPVPESTFRCFSNGYFPDPASCAQYHLCVGDKAYDYECPRGLVYDQGRALCTRTAQCFAFDCRGRATQYLTYVPDETLYALCVSDDSKDAMVASCPAGHRLEAADNSDVACSPFCARVGRFADAEDATGAAYYECLASTSSASDLVGPLRGSCPQGAAFDSASQRCQALVPDKVPTKVLTTPRPTTTEAYTEATTV